MEPAAPAKYPGSGRLRLQNPDTRVTYFAKSGFYLCQLVAVLSILPLSTFSESVIWCTPTHSKFFLFRVAGLQNWASTSHIFFPNTNGQHFFSLFFQYSSPWLYCRFIWYTVWCIPTCTTTFCFLTKRKVLVEGGSRKGGTLWIDCPWGWLN